MRIFAEIFLFFHLAFISTTDCSFSCAPKKREEGDSARGGNEVVVAKSFGNLSGNALEEAVIDEILQRNESSRVRLRHLDIKKITANMLRNLTATSIDFRSNLIEDIESGAFGVVGSKLEKIDLMENRLGSIKKQTFSGDYRKLSEINLSFNAIIGIESGSFEKLVNLRSIDLSANCIRHLHSDLFRKCEELRQVHLHNNDIVKIEFNLFYAKSHLKRLDLAQNHLNFIPAFEMRSIKYLDVSHNNLTRLDLNYPDKSGRGWARVEELTVAFNRIHHCVELRAMRDDIMHLDASHNEITKLSHFAQLPSLEALNIAHNNISKLLPNEFDEKFPSLRVLNLTANAFVSCADYRFLRSNSPHIALTIDTNFTRRCFDNENNNNNFDDDYESDINQHRHRHHRNSLIESSTADEIVRQLKLNRLLLIILLSAIIICAIIHTTFVLRQRIGAVWEAIKRAKIKERLLIENIEL